MRQAKMTIKDEFEFMRRRAVKLLQEGETACAFRLLKRIDKEQLTQWRRWNESQQKEAK